MILLTGYAKFEYARKAVSVGQKEIHSYLIEFSREMKLRDEGKKANLSGGGHNYMKSHYMENVSLEDVACHFMLTASYCSRLIKESMGSNFTQILIEERMKELEGKV